MLAEGGGEAVGSAFDKTNQNPNPSPSPNPNPNPNPNQVLAMLHKQPQRLPSLRRAHQQRGDKVS